MSPRAAVIPLSEHSNPRGKIVNAALRPTCVTGATHYPLTMFGPRHHLSRFGIPRACRSNSTSDAKTLGTAQIAISAISSMGRHAWN